MKKAPWYKYRKMEKEDWQDHAVGTFGAGGGLFSLLGLIIMRLLRKKNTK